MPKKLEIHHYYEPAVPGAFGRHTFIANKLSFSLAELEAAPIIAGPLNRDTRWKITRKPNSVVTVQMPFYGINHSPTGLTFEFGFPYGDYTRTGSKYAIKKGGRSIGTAFNAKVFQFLSEFHGPQTQIMSIDPIKPEMELLFTKAGLDIRSTTNTVGQYATAFKRLLRANKLKRLRRQAGEE